MRIPQKGGHHTVLRLALAACLWGMAPAVAARAGVESLAFPVRGMICPLCTRGVEESVRQVRGVHEVSADLASGRVVVDAEDGLSLNIQEVRERAARAGFPVNGDSDVVARGRFALNPQGRITFKPSGSAYVWQVLENYELLALFRAHPGLKGEFRVGFRLHDRAARGRTAITITRSEAVAPAAVATGP